MFSIDPRTAIVLLVGLLLAITVHEFSHALVARLLGDLTAQRAGRLTLNPIRHLDPLGSLLIVMSMLGGIGMGWGKPVPVDTRALKMGRRGMALVSLAGPLSNFLVAVALFRAIPLLEPLPITGDDFGRLVGLNLSLCAFNLIPLPPLDGSGVLLGVLPWPAASALARLGRYGPPALMLLVFSGYYIHPSPLQIVLSPVLSILFRMAAVLGGAA
jgi:Zn-dependent protease